MFDDDLDYIDNLDLSFLDDDTDAQIDTRKQLKSPKIGRKSVSKRRYIAGLKREALTALVPELPPIDEDLYIISNGNGRDRAQGVKPQKFDFGTFVPYVVSQLGNGCIAYISTWSMNRNHVNDMLEMLDDGRLQALTVLTDPYFKRRSSGVANMLIQGLRQRGQRFIAFQNHAKIVTIRNADSTRFCTILSSANVSSNPRAEVYVLTTHPAAHQFFVSEFFEEMSRVTQSEQ